MHAHAIVRPFIERHLSLIHTARRGTLAAAVLAAMNGHALSLSRLARATTGAGQLRAALKRIDRFIRCARIEREAEHVGRALLRRFKVRDQPLVIAVDWSAVNPGGEFVELRAAVTALGMGRALTVYQRVYPLRQLSDARAERDLLKALQRWIDPSSQVIIVTDAGFRRPWFADVEALGWYWIGRVRSGVNLAGAEPAALPATQWFARATAQATRWRQCKLTARFRWPCDVVLVRRRVVGRQHYARPGHGPTPKSEAEARASAREPWLLVHSPKLSATYRPDEIVALYAQRMQIEENFRDTKSLRFGMGLEASRSRSGQRLHALLLIHTLAAFLLWHIGQLAEAEGLQRRFKATSRIARELSIITLACLLCRSSDIPLTDTAVSTLHKHLGLRR
jgi:hypothetical protein